MDEYRKFEYFSTRTPDLWNHKCNLEQYGLTLSEVESYIYQMENDRLQWEEKRKTLDEWGPILQLFVSFSALFLYGLVSTILYEILKENINICALLAFIHLILLVVFEIGLWKNSRVMNRYNRWLENKYKKKTQNNPIIEKVLEDANFERWKYSNGIKVSSNN